MKTTIQTISREAIQSTSASHPATSLFLAILAVLILVAMVTTQAMPVVRDGYRADRKTAPVATEFFLPAASYRFSPGDVVMQDSRDNKYIVVPPQYVDNEMDEGALLYKVMAVDAAQIRLVRLMNPISANDTPADERVAAVQPDKVKKTSAAAEVSLDRGNYRFVLGDVICWNNEKNGFSAVPVGELLQEMKAKTGLFLVTEVTADAYLVKPLNHDAAVQAEDINITRVETEVDRSF